MAYRLLRASTALATTVVAALAASPSLAQDSGAAVPATPATVQTAANEAPDEIIVTGSRIARPDLAASSPVAVISAEALRVTNAVTVEQILQTNPQFTPAENGASNNPGDGAATVDLRGLGSNRTLVLIDGKRAPQYDTTGSVDVNTIPTALIKRIDILTGGASAVYGSDAVAGVVNFILDDRFTGLRLDASNQVTTAGDGLLSDVSLTGGVKLGEHGNLVVSGNYSKRDGVTFGQRPYTSRALDSGDLVTGAGSSNTVPTAFDVPGQGRLQITPSGVLSSNVQLYNYNPVNYAQIPLERYSGTALGRYELTPGIEAYVRGTYEHVKSVTTLAPTATAGFTFNIDPSNPFLTADERARFFAPATAVINDGSGVGDDPTARAGTSVIGIRRRIIETGGRIENHTTESYQIVGGLRGTFANDFNWDVFAQYGHVKRHEVLQNDLSYSALAQALDVVAGPTGPVCFTPTGGCVPLNLFTTAAIPQSQLAFVLRNATQDTTTSQFVTGANVSGDLKFIQSPLADAPAAVSLGVEYRREKSATAVDPLFASGDLIYYGQGQNVAGSYDTKEAYIEAKVPLVQDKPFFRALDLEGGFRYSHYSTVGDVYTYKGGGDWSPAEGLRFRGIYQRAVRAPSVYELFSPIVGGTGSLNTDPCAGPISASIAAICRAQGAPAASIGIIPQPISGQINIFTGGNPNLKAEKTDTFTVGAVINPPRFRNLSLSVDYYNIRIANAIDTVAPAAIINQCFVIDQNAASPACASIKRNTLDGSLSGNLQFGVPASFQNLAVIKTDGIDVSAGYHGGSSAAFNFGVAFSGTFTRSYTRQGDPTAPAFQCAGRFGGDCNLAPMPKWKHVLDLNLGYDKVTLLSRWRLIGAIKEDADTQILRSRIGPYSYFDETLSVAVNDKYTFRVGVQNLFDKKPPLVGDTVGTDANAGSTFPTVYDVLGQTVFASVSAKF